MSADKTANGIANFVFQSEMNGIRFGHFHGHFKPAQLRGGKVIDGFGKNFVVFAARQQNGNRRNGSMIRCVQPVGFIDAGADNNQAPQKLVCPVLMQFLAEQNHIIGGDASLRNTCQKTIGQSKVVFFRLLLKKLV